MRSLSKILPPIVEVIAVRVIDGLRPLTFHIEPSKTMRAVRNIVYMNKRVLSFKATGDGSGFDLTAIYAPAKFARLRVIMKKLF